MRRNILIFTVFHFYTVGKGDGYVVDCGAQIGEADTTENFDKDGNSSVNGASAKLKVCSLMRKNKSEAI